MPDFREPAYFALLSQELQDMIWSYSMKPRMITLGYARRYPSPQELVIGSSYSHLTGETSKGGGGPHPRQLDVVDSPAPAAFSVCRASRAFAQSSGYRSWRMVRMDGKARDLLWNPFHDTILFIGPHRGHFETFVRQFSDVASTIRSLALPYYFWDAEYGTWSPKKRPSFRIHSERPLYKRGSPGLVQLLKSPSSLQELFIMVDKETFESEVMGRTDEQLDFWSAADGLGRRFHGSLGRFYEGYRDDLSIPKFRVAWNFDMISCKKDRELPEY